jgi:hypothetical protein
MGVYIAFILKMGAIYPERPSVFRVILRAILQYKSQSTVNKWLENPDSSPTAIPHVEQLILIF